LNNNNNKKEIGDIGTRLSQSESDAVRFDSELVFTTGLLFIISTTVFVASTTFIPNFWLALGAWFLSLLVFVFAWRTTKRVGSIATMLAAIVGLLAVLNTYLPQLFQAIEEAIYKSHEDENKA
jgi:predicted PurR-regulated permease PerM